MKEHFRIVERAPSAYYAQVRSRWLPWVWHDIGPAGRRIPAWVNAPDLTIPMAGHRIERFLALKAYPRVVTKQEQDT